MLENYEPANVLKFFEEVSYIPRGSGNEKQVSDYFVSFAKNKNLFVHQDDELNVLIKKAGTPGYENAPTVIIQGHMDIVCEKNEGTEHDFVKDPLDLIVEGDYIRANGTTLGADNGSAIAMGLALLDSDTIQHPPLEVLFTTNEEVGLIGASKFDSGLLDGKILLNLDSSKESVFMATCAGGAETNIFLESEYCDIPQNYEARVLKIKGLKGGHSAHKITEYPANSNILLARALNILESKFSIHLASINGGDKVNAIPREAEATIIFENCKASEISEEINSIEEIFKQEYVSNDIGIRLILADHEKGIEKMFTDSIFKKIVFALMTLPNGIHAMSFTFPDKPETSNNVATVKTTEKEVIISCGPRSSISSKKEMLIAQIKLVSDMLGARMIIKGSYPAWEYKTDSVLREKAKKLYVEMFDSEPVIAATHGGLECGIFSEKIEDVDIISFGPDIYDMHSPDEKMSISSLKRTWEYLQRLLLEIV